MIPKITVQFDQVKFLKEGGGKIIFDFGNDSLDEVKKLLDMQAAGNLLYIIAIAPFSENKDELIKDWEIDL